MPAIKENNGQHFIYPIEIGGNFKVRWGSHDSTPCEIAGYYEEQ